MTPLIPLRQVGILLFWIATALSCPAQNRANVWYFGDNIGLDFNQRPPRLLTDGRIRWDSTGGSESASSICDTTGRLLFYTDGVTVWNRNHQPMPNGTDLWGASTTTQTLIVPVPGSETLFYIFTCSPTGNSAYFPIEKRGFRFTTVDISLQSGLGDVIQKNILIHPSTTEKVAATLHTNNRDVWVVMHEWNTNLFRSYLITEMGMSANPVISQTGLVHTGPINPFHSESNAIGQMKISPDGSLMAVAIFYDQVAEVFRFNNASGQIDLITSLTDFAESSLYGVEFSLNSRYLYIADRSRYIFQFDLHQKDVLASRYKFGNPNRYDFPASLQLAPDGKIYIAKYDSEFLGIIHNPDESKAACNHEAVGVRLGVNGFRYCRQGLPNFISSYFLPPAPVLAMPNVFTPNGDDSNEVFLPMRQQHVASARLEVYNRWGQPLFQTDDLTKGWDGGESPAGTYYWLVRYEGTNGKAYTSKGFVELLR